MAGPDPLRVVGSGPVALAFALFAAPHRPVVLAAGRPQGPPRRVVESVPAPLLTLLLELGVVPAEVDVARLHRRRLVAWETPRPEPRPARAAAHLERSALLGALWRRVDACGAIRVVDHRGDGAAGGTGGAGDSDRGGGSGGAGPAAWVDTRGRAASQGGRRLQPRPAWLATMCTVPRRWAPADGDLRLAAGRAGYGYRLASAGWLTVGWVSPARPPRSAEALAATLTDAGAGWLLDGVTLGAPVSTRVASLSVAAPPEPGGPIRLGDAALARDALASQGLALGLSDARLAARRDWTAVASMERTAEAFDRHVRSLAGVLASCRYRAAPAWQGYADWLNTVAAALGRDVPGPEPAFRPT